MAARDKIISIRNGTVDTNTAFYQPVGRTSEDRSTRLIFAFDAQFVALTNKRVVFRTVGGTLLAPYQIDSETVDGVTTWYKEIPGDCFDAVGKMAFSVYGTDADGRVFATELNEQDVREALTPTGGTAPSVFVSITDACITATTAANTAAQTANDAAESCAGAEQATKDAEALRVVAESARAEQAAGDHEAIAPTIAEIADARGAFANLDARLDGVDAQLSHIMTPVTAPIGFGWNDNPLTGHLFRVGKGTFVTNLDLAEFAPSIGTKKTYYVATNGSDSNNGTAPETPLRSISVAIAKTDADIIEIIIASGTYTRAYGWNSVSPTRNAIVKAALGAKVISSVYEAGLSWALVGGYTGVYSATRSNVAGVFDSLNLAPNGDYSKLTLRTSISDVAANPGSWFLNGTTLYIKTIDSRTPDANIRPMLIMNNGYVRNNVTVYVEGITFEGGSQAFFAENVISSPRVILKNCAFKYATGTNALGVIGAEYAYTQNCIAASSVMDGFNYHVGNGVIPVAVEIDCTGRDNGDSENNDNGSTAHNGVKIIRLNCTYYQNKGPNCIDVDPGTKSWNIGCKALDSSGSSSINDFDLAAGAIGWFDGCVANGLSAKQFVIESGSIGYVHDCDFGAQQTIIGSKIFY